MKQKNQFMHVRGRSALAAGGFSLVEMLVVIAVIGIIVATAVPTIGSVTKQANDAKVRRNAQNLAAVGAAAQAVGFEYVSTTKNEAVAELITGVTGTGQFANNVFRVPNLSGDDLKNARHLLRFEHGTLQYRSDHLPH
jgi:prepilin-type N-terminal cleavage/methylation domain-containing protein